MGTFISFCIIACLTYLFNYINLFTVSIGKGSRYLNLSIEEILLFSSVISSTDTVSALTFIKENKYPKLFSILFGEGIFNDAVSIVLFKIVVDFNSSNGGKTY
jgi:NhaP-type Na+/H+ or K+/H+ antiporter